MPESPIRKLVPFAEKAKKKGLKVYHLNIGQPDIHSPEVAIQAIRNYSTNVVEYTHSAGNESYRKKLAGYYNKVGINVSFEDVMITTGGSEALLFGMMSCLNEGDEVIIPEPFYANYIAFAITAGVKIVPVTSSIENGFALPSISEFEKKITPKTKAILVCNPSNPTGYLYTEAELKVLRDIILKHDLFLFADEVYREFVYDGRTHFSVMNLQGVDDKVVLVDSVSKRYSMCGARIGALVSRNKEVMSTALKFGQARLSPPTFGQIAGEAAIDTPDSYFEEVVEEYVERRNFLVTALNEIPGVVCPNPGGAFYTVAKLPVENAEHFCQWMLSEFEYQGQTVMMAPAQGFYMTNGLGKDEVRIAYVLKIEDLKASVDCLKAGLEQYTQIMETVENQ